MEDEEDTYHIQTVKRDDAFPWENSPYVHEEAPSSCGACKDGQRDLGASCAASP